MASALPIAALCGLLTACQWGSGNVMTGDLTVVKQFINCPEASSGLGGTADAGTAAGGTPEPTLSASAAYVGALSTRDLCHAISELEDATVQPEPAP